MELVTHLREKSKMREKWSLHFLTIFQVSSIISGGFRMEGHLMPPLLPTYKQDPKGAKILGNGLKCL